MDHRRGIPELRQLGLYDRLLAAGAHHVTRHTSFFEDGTDASEDAELSELVRGVPGPLTMQHVKICEVLNDAAVGAGARLLRGVERLEFPDGTTRRVAFLHDGKRHEIACDLLVGADGRGSSVGRWLGIDRLSDPPHHLMAGLLVEGAEKWPETVQTIGTEGDVAYFVFPQGSGRVRLYLAYARGQKGRFAGSHGAARFLDAFRLNTVAGSEVLASARLAGPCHGYPNEDVWAPDPVADGAVLIGDAAGHNDPVGGQGLAVAFRDARLVSEIILDIPRGKSADFRPYVHERRERMRRMRFMSRLVSEWRVAFDDEARKRRLEIRLHHVNDPEARLPALSALLGAHNLPAEVFTAGSRERFFGQRMPDWTDALAPLQPC